MSSDVRRSDTSQGVPSEMSEEQLPGLDASQRELYREGGETDTRSQEAADEYEEGGSDTDRTSSDQGGQRVRGGQYGTESDANQPGIGQASHSPNSSQGGD
jgi:hypothetical protein